MPANAEPKLKKEWQPLYSSRGRLRIQSGSPRFFDEDLAGKQIIGGGFGEIEQAVDLLVSQPPARILFATCSRIILWAMRRRTRAIEQRAKNRIQHGHGDIRFAPLFDRDLFDAASPTK